MNVEVAQIWSEFQQELKGFIFKRVQNEADAEDILQDVFIKVIRNKSKLSEALNMRGYLYTMVRNAVMDFFRKQKQVMDLAEANDIFTEEEAEDLYTTLAICCVKPFIEELPEKYRSALVQVELNGLPQKDLAKNLDISYSAAKSRVQRGREKLKDLIVGCCRQEKEKFKTILQNESPKCDC